MTQHASKPPSIPPQTDDWLMSDPLGMENDFIDVDMEIDSMSQRDDSSVMSNMPQHLVNITPAVIQEVGVRQLVLDTETTGLDHLQGDRLIEIGIIEVINRKPTGSSLHVYINPEREVGDSFRIHGISDDFLKDKPKFAQVAQLVANYIRSSDLIAHNSAFDLKFLDMEFSRLGLPLLSETCRVIDSLAIAKAKHPTQKNNLDALVRRYEVPVRDRTYHGALLDAQILTDVYLKMTGGQVLLAMDAQSEGEEGGSFMNRKLPKLIHTPSVIASPEELSAHEEWLSGHKKPEQFLFVQLAQPTEKQSE